MKASHIMGAIITLLIVAIFLMTSGGPAVSPMHGPQVSSFSASKGIQPYATMNTNITWSDFNSGWAWNEYNNGTSNLSLDTGLSKFYQNPISINPADIVAPGILQEEKTGGTYWNETSYWGINTPNGGAVTTLATYTYNGESIIQSSMNTSKAAANDEIITNAATPLANMPSNNPAYDYITIIAGVNGPTITGNTYQIQILNYPTTGSMKEVNLPINATTNSISAKNQTNFNDGTVIYATFSLTQLNNLLPSPIFNTTGSNPSKNIGIQISQNIQKSNTSGTYTTTIYGFAITNDPLTIGSKIISQTQKTPFATYSNLTLNNLKPNFRFSAIENGGYTVATTQSLQNVTKTQIAIQNGSYIEEVQKQGQFILPSAPDLTYGPANITETLNVSSSQVMVLDINGLSYLSSISGKNGTINLIGSVNPTSSTSFLEIVEYTSSQWNSISGPPGFFSVAGVEYYFDEIVLGLTALLGIGGAAAHRRAAQLRRVK